MFSLVFIKFTKCIKAEQNHSIRELKVGLNERSVRRFVNKFLEMEKVDVAGRKHREEKYAQAIGKIALSYERAYRIVKHAVEMHLQCSNNIPPKFRPEQFNKGSTRWV